MTRMTGPDCAVMRNLINMYTNIHRYYIHTWHIHTYYIINNIPGTALYRQYCLYGSSHRRHLVLTVLCFFCFLYFLQLAIVVVQIKKYVQRGGDVTIRNALGDTLLHEVKNALALRRRGEGIERYLDLVVCWGRKKQFLD